MKSRDIFAASNHINEMASLSDVLRSYSILQRHRFSTEIAPTVSSRGIITVTLRKWMSFGGIIDESLLVLYDIYLRQDTATAGFRSMVNLDWDRNSYKGSKKFTFNLMVPSIDVQELLSEFTINEPINSPAASEVVAVCNVETNGAPPISTPSFKRPRVSKILAYSPATLAKYSKNIESKFLNLLNEEIPSANEELRNQVAAEVILRLESRFTVTDIDSCDVNSKIVANLKYVVTSMTKYGRNDREQIKFKENLALAIFGKLSYAKLMVATGLSRRQLENGSKMREVFTKATEIAMKDNENHDIINEIDDDGSEVDSDVESNEEGSESDDDVPEKKKRAANGEGQKNIIKNRYRQCFSAKSRKVRCDAISGREF